MLCGHKGIISFLLIFEAMEHLIKNLRDTVQYNCNISDACHAGTYTMCVYLLKMREYFRWENGYSFAASLDQSELGVWLCRREADWESLRCRSFKPLHINGQSFDPFDTDAINYNLLPYGYIYSGGIGAKSVPHFFIAEYESQSAYKEYQVLVSAKEYARDLTAPPGMSLAKTIFIRKESLKRMIWEKLNEWHWSRPRNAMATALSYYDFDHDLEGSLARMTEVETETVLLHEIGELEAHRYLPEDWQRILQRNSTSKTELLMRAIKDNLADSIALLPALISSQKSASIHFYIANLSAMRKALSPTLIKAYQAWLQYNDFALLESLLSPAKKHWQEKACLLLKALVEENDKDEQSSEALIEQYAF